ncbi:MAG: FMN-binding glutamate synthase family protein, partial [Cocleimonas sp.]|nr:FMN-binding glutamate synthase family protein [Cocleimonas sp.]
KKDRVAAYANNLVYEVGTIAHSCGVTEPRGLRRHHARIVMSNSLSIRLDQLYPLPSTKEKPSFPAK